MIAADSTRPRGRALATERNQRRRQDLEVAIHLILRSVGPIDDLIRALEGAGGCVRLVGGLRTTLALRRGGGR